MPPWSTWWHRARTPEARGAVLHRCPCKEALNFQISVTIYAIVCAILILVMIGFVLLVVLILFALNLCDHRGSSVQKWVGIPLPNGHHVHQVTGLGRCT